MKNASRIKRPKKRQRVIDRIRRTLRTKGAICLTYGGGDFRTVFRREGLMLHAVKVRGGYAVWVERRLRRNR